LACSRYVNPTLVVFSEGHTSDDWSLISWSDEHSVIHHKKSPSSIGAEFKLSDASKWYNAGIAINFNKDVSKLVDLSEFNQAKISLKCSPANILYFGLSSRDEKVTQENTPITYRRAGVHISCDTEWHEITVNFDSLEVPLWWLQKFEFKASDNKANLDKIIQIFFETTAFETPLNVDSKIHISNILFSGRREGVLLNFTLLAFFIWIVCGAWTIRFYVKGRFHEKEVSQQLKYEQLTFNPVREREKQAILEYISKNFANPEIDNESVSKVAGVSRTRVNEILKSEYGNTFTNYINKLRLVEASRLLIEKPDAHITEIAYLVGFKNISYFNKLFKEEFGLTPKEIRGKGAQI
jgi:AraC-like DNA-binding protein